MRAWLHFMYFISVGVTMALLPELAYAACSASQIDMPSLSNLTLSLASGSTSNYTVTRTTTAAFCDYYVAFGGGNNNVSFNPRRLRRGSSSNYVSYNLYQSSSNLTVLKDAASASATAVQIGNFPSGTGSTTDNKSYHAVITESLGNVRTSGSYTDTVAVSMYRSSNAPPGGTLDRTRNVTLTLSYPLVTRIALVATGAAYNDTSNSQSLNFGTLSTGLSLAFDLLSVSNQNYSVKFSSANNGRLKHSTQTQYVNYTLTANSVTINLASSLTTPVAVVTGTGCCTVDGGTRTPINVTIGTVSTQLAGSYSDTITVTITNP